MSRALLSFLHDRRAAAMAEFAIIAPFFFIFVLMTIEFGIGMRDYNAAAKAAQIGARMAAVSSPVATVMSGNTLDGAGAAPGGVMPAFLITCTGVGAGSCSNGGYSAAAMNWIVRGGDNRCGAPFVGRLGMCDFYSRITPANVTITYENAGGANSLGYTGRPLGAAASITVRLTNLTYNTPLAGSFIGQAFNLQLPPFATTATSEDLRGTP
jgi:hypothetical protein